MDYEETRTIVTPEGVQLELPLAGLGTRFLAISIDLTIGISVAFMFIIFGAIVGGGLGAGIAAALTVLVFYLGYQVLLEVLGGGRTVGKRAAGIRVVMDGGAPVGLRASLIRNSFLLIEGVFLLYLPAIICELASRNNQRLGDHAAGTLVIRDRRYVAPSFGPPPVPPAHIASWDVTGVSEQDASAVRLFLVRRWGFEPGPRAALAAELANKLRPEIAGARPGLPDEAFLEHLISAKTRPIAREEPPDGGKVRTSY